jgi:chemotaxis protein methyltransferase CheR
MSASPSSGDVERFRGIVARGLGLHFEESGLGRLADVLKKRLEATRQSAEVYFANLDLPMVPRTELGAIAGELTVAETYFFRNPDQFRAFVQSVLPDRMAARRGVHRLRVLSAGCASGEEPYTVAMVLRESLDPSWEVSIRAVDINPAMILKARQTRYGAWSLRATPPQTQRRWFTQQDRDFVLDSTLCQTIVFEERNLSEDDADLWKSESYDVVFCRNVLMYFEPDAAQSLVSRIARALMPGGYLFLGHAETLRGLSQEFHLQHSEDAFYYRRKAVMESDGRSRGGAAGEPQHASLPLPVHALIEDAGTWVEAIQNSADRIRELTRDAKDPSGPAALKPGWDLGRLLELLGRERFGDALDLVRAFPPESAADPEVLLLRAVLLTHSGEFAGAESVCRELLEIEDFNSGAHYLLALCREGVRDTSGAIDQDQIAVYLDPDFAMPRLHLGLIARRAGDSVMALREFGHALLLLQREDPARLLMFGGGFRREALIALCRSAIVSCGGRA